MHHINCHVKSCFRKKLLDETCEIMRRFHYSIHTERSYCGWIRQFIHFHKLQTRESLYIEPKRKVEAFLTHFPSIAAASSAGGYSPEQLKKLLRSSESSDIPAILNYRKAV